MTHSGSFSVARSSEEVFDLLSTPGWFAPTMPDFVSMAIQDATHFTMRTVIAIGEIKGHANLAMELQQAVRPSRVEYRGSATIAGGPLRLAIDFQISPRDAITDVTWQGDVTLGGTLALMAGALLDTMGRQSFERMSERLQFNLQREPLATRLEAEASADPAASDFEI
jgi:carbon monoxide dehydrogenase subunit G